MDIEAPGFIAGTSILLPRSPRHYNLIFRDNLAMTEEKSVAVIGGEADIQVYRSLEIADNP